MSVNLDNVKAIVHNNKNVVKIEDSHGIVWQAPTASKFYLNVFGLYSNNSSYGKTGYVNAGMFGDNLSTNTALTSSWQDRWDYKFCYLTETEFNSIKNGTVTPGSTLGSSITSSSQLVNNINYRLCFYNPNTQKIMCVGTTATVTNDSPLPASDTWLASSSGTLRPSVLNSKQFFVNMSGTGRQLRINSTLKAVYHTQTDAIYFIYDILSPIEIEI